MEIKISQEPPFSFTISEKTGHIQFQSRDYEQRKDAENSIQGFAQGNPHRFERFTDTEGLFRFRILNQNSSSLGQSIGYHSKAGMENALKNLRMSFGV